jgi:signal transduction histidine kinase
VLDPSDLLRSVSNRFEWRAEEAARSLHASVGPPVQVEGDRIRLEQALGNLVDNALRYGEGEVRLSALQANGMVELHVTDEGPGFPTEFLGDAFERFSRSDPARSGGGAGLGLAIVGAIAEAHAGTAHAANRDGAGADVWIALPTMPPS